MKRLGWVGALLGVLMAVLGSSPATAGGGGGGGGGEVSANVTGTGKIIANGQAAWVNFVITCPKGAAWSVDAGAGFNFVSETGEQVPGRLVVSSGKCSGKTDQAIKIKFLPFPGREPLGPGCGDYMMSIVVAGTEIFLNWSPGVDEVTGPPVCLS